ncbi:MAG: FUN14 domain-containing protein [Candidatus Nitrosopolaris sp.]
MPFEDFLFSAGGGFLFGALAGYAIKKVMKIVAVVIGLFVAALAYLSYRGWVDVKWVAIEDASRSTLTNASERVVHTLMIRQHNLQRILLLLQHQGYQ